MTISVIIPVYNVEKYLRECVESVCKLRTPAQIVLVNDGSTDNSGALCDALAAEDARIKVIHQENGGVTRARFRGISEATGSWIGFVDGDDYIEPEMYRILIDNAVKYKFMTEESRKLAPVFKDAESLIKYLEEYKAEDYNFSVFKKV